MNILPIKNEADYAATLERISQLMDAERDSPEGDELEVLAMMVEAYEDKNYPIADCDPIEFLKYAMESQGYKQKDLAKLLNSRPRASEILNRQRPLSLSMIRLISKSWQVPAEPLLREYKLST